MMKNAGPDFEGQFYDVPTISLVTLLLAQEEISHSYPFDWRTKKYLSEQYLSGFASWQNSVKF